MNDLKIFVEYRNEYGAFAVRVTTNKSDFLKLATESDDIVSVITHGIAQVKKLEVEK